ncbi:hypothetical protein PRIPAC_83533 [Pristionchus pacificus]|uniref:Uncharacterized protein n=1 Tax=Pristionchus pacificus TaxID=54126 RepID=A0A2A6BLX9_PRIPA|nr:hypothetical protein PRIPAC_83533 [Pristionchus pacificus]|eukprot:PDM66920.1 hypothetical protein PRIPAC_48337 [Pristionchus pacificus]
MTPLSREERRFPYFELNSQLKNDELDIKIYELVTAVRSIESWPMFRCQILYCHCENKNYCRSKCWKYARLKIDEYNMKLPGKKGRDEATCVKDCTALLLKEGPLSVEVCQNLCAIDYSYPDREKWEQQIAIDLPTSNNPYYQTNLLLFLIACLSFIEALPVEILSELIERNELFTAENPIQSWAMFRNKCFMYARLKIEDYLEVFEGENENIYFDDTSSGANDSST